MAISWLFGALALVALSDQSHAQAPRRGAGRAKGANKPAARSSPLSKEFSEQDARAFADAMSQALQKGDKAAFNALIDWDAIYETALQGMNLTKNQTNEFMNELRKHINDDAGFTSQMVQNYKNGGRLDYLRTRERNRRQVVLLRMTLPVASSGVNYYEFVLKRSPDLKIRASDLYVYLSAEFFTESLHRVFLPIVASINRNFLEKLVTSDRQLVDDLAQIQEVSGLLTTGKNKEALAKIKSFAPVTQKEKMVLLLRLKAAQAISEQEYTSVMEDFRKLYPNDPCIDIISIDYYTLKKDLPKALAATDRLDKAVGGDPFLNLARAGMCELNGDLEAAQEFGTRAMTEDPTMINAYWYVISVANRRERYDDTLATLKKVDQNFAMKFNDLTRAEPFAGFVKSPQYKQWLKYLDQKSKGDQQPTPKDSGKNGKTG